MTLPFAWQGRHQLAVEGGIVNPKALNLANPTPCTNKLHNGMSTRAALITRIGFWGVTIVY